jgi:hypothetical protein
LNLKRKVVLKRSLKKKRKKTKPYLLTFRPKRPRGPSPPSRTGPPLPLSFSFLLLSLTPGPHLSASPSPLPFLLPPARRPLPQPRGSRRAPPSSLPFSPQRARQLRQLIAHSNPRPFPLFPLPSLHPDGPAAINGKPAGRPVPFRFAFLPTPLFKLALELLRPPLRPQHPNARNRAPIHLCRRLGFPPPPSNRRRR